MDIITYAIFLKAFSKLSESPPDIERPGITLMTVVTYAYILMNNLMWGGGWLALDGLMFLLVSFILLRTHLDASGERPKSWTWLFIGLSGTLLVLTSSAVHRPETPDATLPSTAADAQKMAGQFLDTLSRQSQVPPSPDPDDRDPQAQQLQESSTTVIEPGGDGLAGSDTGENQAP